LEASIFQSTEAGVGALCRPFEQVRRVQIVSDQTDPAGDFALVEMHNDATPRFLGNAEWNRTSKETHEYHVPKAPEGNQATRKTAS